MKHEAAWLLGAAGAYGLAIMPRMRRGADWMKGVYYAHRGLHDEKAGIPENTMASFARAVENGYGIELDVQLTKDQKVVVFHDFDLKRICSVDGRVCDYTYEELQAFDVCGTKERIPLLADVLKLVDGRVPLLVELKSETFSTLVCVRTDELLRCYDGVYSIESFHPVVLWWYRKHRPEICRGQLSMNFQRREGNYAVERIAARHLLFNFIGRPDFIAYDMRDRKSVSRNICRRLFGCPSAAWTVRSQKELAQIRADYDAFIFEGFRPVVK